MTHKPAKPTYKRQQYWVDAPLQLQMVAYVLVLISASLGLTALSVLRGVQEASYESHQIFHSLEWIKAALFAPLLLASAISLLAGGLVTLFWSHRFAGPLRVISAGAARIRHGNLAVPVRVRVTDAHQEFTAEFQKMQDELRKMIEADRVRIASAVASLESAEKALEEDGDPDESIAKALHELKHACTQYHL
jgi:nitrogen fixation/metabolism regulation signal transduction histidine kinase